MLVMFAVIVLTGIIVKKLRVLIYVAGVGLSIYTMIPAFVINYSSWHNPESAWWYRRFEGMPIAEELVAALFVLSIICVILKLLNLKKNDIT